MGKKSHLEQLREFKKRVKKRLPIKKIILFGSRARGRARRDSDFDLIIVSSSFQKVSPLKRSIHLYDDWTLDYPVDFLCYTPEEFKRLKGKMSIVQEALENGMEI